MDVLCVKACVEFAVDYCRAGNGPFVLEMDTYRCALLCFPHVSLSLSAEHLPWTLRAQTTDTPCLIRAPHTAHVMTSSPCATRATRSTCAATFAPGLL
jgi:hypothetical protein